MSLLRNGPVTGSLPLRAMLLSLGASARLRFPLIHLLEQERQLALGPAKEGRRRWTRLCRCIERGCRWPRGYRDAVWEVPSHAATALRFDALAVELYLDSNICFLLRYRRTLRCYHALRKRSARVQLSRPMMLGLDIRLGASHHRRRWLCRRAQPEM